MDSKGGNNSPCEKEILGFGKINQLGFVRNQNEIETNTQKAFFCS